MSLVHVDRCCNTHDSDDWWNHSVHNCHVVSLLLIYLWSHLWWLGLKIYIFRDWFRSRRLICLILSLIWRRRLIASLIAGSSNVRHCLILLSLIIWNCIVNWQGLIWACWTRYIRLHSLITLGIICNLTLI
jgi:hypothetical protein